MKFTVGIFLLVAAVNKETDLIFKEVIHAMRQQTFTNWRCLIIADDPDKNFLNYLILLRKEEKRIDLLVHNYLVKDIVRLKNIGLKYFDNVPFIMYLCDDLIMKSDCLGKMVSVLRKYPGFGVVSPTDPVHAHQPMFANKFIEIGVLWTKEAIDKTGVIDLNLSPNHWEDHEHMLRMIEKGGFIPHRVIDAIVTHKKIGKGTLARVLGKIWMDARDSHISYVCKKYGRNRKEIEKMILNFPAIKAE